MIMYSDDFVCFFQVIASILLRYNKKIKTGLTTVSVIECSIGATSWTFDLPSSSVAMFFSHIECKR